MSDHLRLLKEHEAAAVLGIGGRTLRDLRRRGLIRYVAVTDRKIMYRTEDCAEYIESRLRQDEPCQRPPKPQPKLSRRRGGNVIPFTQQIGG